MNQKNIPFETQPVKMVIAQLTIYIAGEVFGYILGQGNFTDIFAGNVKSCSL